MVEINITGIPESTVKVSSKEITKISNVLSFQNISRSDVYWSTSVMNDTNIGALVNSSDERVFSTPQIIYIKNTDSRSIANIHVRSISL